MQLISRKRRRRCDEEPIASRWRLRIIVLSGDWEIIVRSCDGRRRSTTTIGGHFEGDAWISFEFSITDDHPCVSAKDLQSLALCLPRNGEFLGHGEHYDESHWEWRRKEGCVGNQTPPAYHPLSVVLGSNFVSVRWQFCIGFFRLFVLYSSDFNTQGLSANTSSTIS